MFKKFLLKIFLLVIIVSCSDKDDTFIFNPSDGFKYKEFISMETIIKSVGSKEGSSSKISLVNDVLVEKTNEGFTYNAFISKADQIVDGVVIENPIFGAMVGSNIVYEIKADGKISDIRGYDKVAEKAMASMTKEMLEQSGGNLTAEMLSGQEKKNWSERVESLLGRGSYKGSKWAAVKEFTLPTGNRSKYYAGFKVEGVATCDGSEKCVLLAYSFYSDVDDVAEYVDSLFSNSEENEFVGSNAGDNFRVTSVTVSGKGARIVDPETLVIYKDGAEARVVMEIEVKGEQMQAVESVTRTDYFIEVAK